MRPLVGSYLFLLGLTSGLALLAITSYRRVTPRWLRWLLMASGVFLISRYVAMACFTQPEAPRHCWALRHYWLASSVGLTLPGVVALDQLIKHPAMSPNRLLAAYAPFLLAYAAVMLFGSYAPQPDPQGGWVPALSLGWRLMLSVVQGIFVAGFIGLCLVLARKLPSRSIRVALLALAGAYAYLGMDGLLLASRHWYFRPFLFSEMATLLALWHAYEISAKPQTMD